MPEVAEYDSLRAEMLAHLVLTRRKDVYVVDLNNGPDLGIDLFVRIGNKPSKAVPCFGVQVLGTDDNLLSMQVANRYANRKWKHQRASGYFLFPVVVFLFSTSNDKGYFSWLVEPYTPPNEDPRLTPVEILEMTKLDKSAVDMILDRVLQWADGMEKMIERESKEIQ